MGLIVTLVVTILLPIGENKKTETERTQIVEHLPKNTKTVELPGLPYPQFHHMGDPTENTYMTPFFKLYMALTKQSLLLKHTIINKNKYL